MLLCLHQATFICVSDGLVLLCSILSSALVTMVNSGIIIAQTTAAQHGYLTITDNLAVYGQTETLVDMPALPFDHPFKIQAVL